MSLSYLHFMMIWTLGISDFWCRYLGHAGRFGWYWLGFGKDHSHGIQHGRQVSWMKECISDFCNPATCVTAWSHSIMRENQQLPSSPTLELPLRYNIGLLNLTAMIETLSTVHITHSPVRRINHTIINISPIIPPILRKKNRFPTRARKGKAHNKNNNLRSPIKARTKHVIEFQKPLRLVPSQIELAPESDQEETNDSGVDAGDEPSDVPGYDGNVQVVEAGFGKEAVQGINGEGCDEAKDEPKRYPLVRGTRAVHLFREAAPRHCLGIEGLETLCCQLEWGSLEGWDGKTHCAAPDVSAFNRQEDVSLVCRDGERDDVIQDCANQRPNHLHCECASGA
jgi:hypothetical protein